jgi:hypothetical protein
MQPRTSNSLGVKLKLLAKLCIASQFSSQQKLVSLRSRLQFFFAIVYLLLRRSRFCAEKDCGLFLSPRKIKLWRLIAELARGSVFFPSRTFNTQRNENKRWSRGVPICASGTFHPPTHAKSAVAVQRASSGSRPSIQFTSAAAVVSVLSGAMPCH